MLRNLIDFGCVVVLSFVFWQLLFPVREGKRRRWNR